MLLLPAVGRSLPCGDAPLSSPQAVRLAVLAPLLVAIVPRRALWAFWLALAGLACWCGALAAADLARRPAVAAVDPHGPSVRVRTEGAAALRLTARPRQNKPGQWSAPAVILSWQGPPSLARMPRAGDGVLVRLTGEPPVLGTALTGRWRLEPPRRATVSGGFDEAIWLQGRGLQWIATAAANVAAPAFGGGGIAHRIGRVQSSWQARMRGVLAAGLPAREADLAGAVLLGGGAPAVLKEPFTRLGLAHLFALSGLHVGIVSGLLLGTLGTVVRGASWRLGLMTAALGAYTVLVDAPDSVVRAVGLVLLALAARAFARLGDGLRFLGLLLWLNLAWQPASLLDAGQRLSYLAAGGIVTGQRLLGPLVRPWPRWRRWPLAALNVTVSAQLATLPVVAESFGVLPLGGPLANLVAVPCFGLAVSLVAAGLAVAFCWEWAADALLACGWVLLRLLQVAAAAAGDHLGWLERGLPVWGPVRWVSYAATVGLLVAAWQRRGWRWYVLAAALYPGLLLLGGAGGDLVDAARNGRVQAWQFAIGQGDCALLRLPDRWTCLIDTGPSRPDGDSSLARDVLPFLRRLNVRRLDAVVLSHAHDDHTGGAADLAAALPIDWWLLAGKTAAPRPGLPAGRPQAGDTLHAAGGWALLCVHPPARDWPYRHENDASLSLALCRDGRLHGLWTGDLETAGEAAMLAHLPPAGPAGADVWKAGHHGSRTSGSEPLLAAVRPQLVVISCGVANRHRHPSHGPYPGATEVRTDLRHTVHLSWDRRGRMRWRSHLSPPPPP